MHHRLLVAGRVVGEQVLVLGQRLAQAGDVAVAEDAQAPGEEALAPAVALDVLGGEEADEGLGDGEGLGFGHAGLQAVVSFMGQPCQGGLEVRQLGAEPLGGDVASSRVSRGMAPPASASAAGPDVEQVGVEPKAATARRASPTRSACSPPQQCRTPLTSRSSASQMSSAASVASVGVASG